MLNADKIKASAPTTVSAAIYGCAGHRLSEEEKSFFRQARPYGFILFARNCESPAQVKALVEELRAVSYDAAPVLIDQEGGRVARLQPPHWRRCPPAAVFAALDEADSARAEEAVYLNARLIGSELHALGIDVDCAPLLDVPSPGSHDIIGDRAFGDAPERVIRLGKAMAEGLLDSGVLPVIKHMPGHGRANADSHLELPVVDAPLEAMQALDFPPFKALAGMPYGMTAHVLYTALDAREVATFSPVVIEFIRRELGFDGLLMSDDLSMKALGGGFAERARKALAAGCDLVLHCNGDMEEMRQVAEGTGVLSPMGHVRALRARQALRAFKPMDKVQTAQRLEHLLTGVESCSLA